MARPRSEQSRQAVLKAALALAQAQGYSAFTIEELAAAAGVGKQTIYRWWTSRGQIVLEALRDHAKNIPAPKTGTLEGDLAAFLRTTFRYQRGTGGVGNLLKGLMAEAQIDAAFARCFAEFIGARREVLRSILLRHVAASRTAEIEAAVDMTYGAMWYRLLIGHLRLDAGLAKTLAKLLARQFKA